MDLYDVARWQEWSSYTFPIIEVVEAEGSIKASTAYA
jgi:hypothetical protein